MTNVTSVKLPSYFYKLDGILPDGTPRWVDEFPEPEGDSLLVDELNQFALLRCYERNVAYSLWLNSFVKTMPNGVKQPILKPKQFKWQAIRVIKFTHSESNRHKDWWENYQEACFRVFLQPETVYCHKTGQHKQWYLLSPEDCFMVNRYEAEKNGPELPPRDRAGEEKYLIRNHGKDLRRARLIPVECCKHMRHETTGGVLPEGL